MVIWFLIKVPRQFNGEEKVFSTNGAIKSGYPHEEEKKNFIHHTIHKLIQKMICRWKHRIKIFIIVGETKIS